MPFPLSAQGTITVDTRSPDDFVRVINSVENAIRDAKPTAISRHNEQINFRAGLFRLVSNWNQLVAIGSGELHFSQQDKQVEIHYRISFLQLFIAVTVMVTLMFGVLPSVSGQNMPLGFVAVAWLWLFGCNYVITLVRFPGFVRTAAERACTQNAHPF